MKTTLLTIGILALLSIAVSPGRAETFTQSDANATDETGDQFGRTLATGDFNNDGYADLVVAVPYENTDGADDTGMIDVFYGSSSGLSTSYETITQNSIVTATNEDGDRMGWSLAVGNFNGDAYDDLAVGIPYEDTDGATDTGMVAILFGSGNGLLPSNTEAITQNSVITATNEDGDLFGYALAAGNFNGDAYDDLAVGVPGENTDGATDTGMVAILFGSANGLLPSNTEAITQNSVITATNEDGDQFGYALAAGNFDGDGFDDLAVGIPFENTDGATDTGLVGVLYGSNNGLLPSSSEAFTQNSISGQTNEDGDNLGRTLAVGNFNGDAYQDLVVGAPREDFGSVNASGAAFVMYGSAAGLLPSNTETLTQAKAYDEDEAGDWLASSLATGDFDADGFDDVVLGVPLEDIANSGSNTGAIQAYFGSAAGLLPERSYWAGQVTFGAAEEDNDQFGFALAAGDFDGDGRDGLAVGTPFEDVGNIVDAGAVFVQEIDAALPQITARAAIVFNRNTGEVVASKMPDLRLAMASTTKIMTGLLAVEEINAGNLNLDDTVTISTNAATVSGTFPNIGSSMNGPGTRSLAAGDRLSLEDLLYGCMLPSGNNAAIGVGEAVAGTEADFVNLMNARASSLGMNRTAFATPHGRDPEKTMANCPNISFSQSINLVDPGCAHFSTPRDLARLADHALGLALFRDIVDTPLWTTTTWVNSGGSPQNDTQSNTNRLIRNVPGLSSSNRYRGAYGVKTGTTGNAGECLVSAAERCGVDLVAVVLGSDDSTNSRYPDSRAILDFAFDRLIEAPETFALNFTESFESDGLGCRFFVEGIDDAPVDVDEGDYLGVIPTNLTPYSNDHGSALFAVQDIDDNGQGDGQGTLTFVPFETGAATSVRVSMRVGAGTSNAFDAEDAIRVEYRFGQGAWNLLAAFESDGAPGGSRLYEDTDLDGTGDGAVLDRTLTNFSWTKFTGGNPTIQLRVRFLNFDSGSESAAIDYLRVIGVGPGGLSAIDWALSHDLPRLTPTADTDGNGIGDWMEFLFNQNPNDPHDTRNMPGLTMERNGDLFFRFSRLKTSGGSLVLEKSANLRSGSWGTAIEGGDYRVVSTRTNTLDPAQEDVVILIVREPGSERLYFRLNGTPPANPR